MKNDDLMDSLMALDPFIGLQVKSRIERAEKKCRGNLKATVVDYQWGVYFEGAGLGWVKCDTYIEAQWCLQEAGFKHLPGRIGRRPIGEIEFDENDFRA